MKRYWAFAYDDYYPSGGIGDRIGMFVTLEEARTGLRDYVKDHWRDSREIVDIETGQVVEDNVA